MLDKYRFAPELHALPLECSVSKRRKTLGLKVSAGRVLVSYPASVAPRDVVHWVNNKRHWILKHYEPAPAAAVPSAYKATDVIYWNGNFESIETLIGMEPLLDRSFLNLSLTLQKQALLKLCAQAIEPDLSKRVESWRQVLGLHPRSIKYRPYKSRWGSCTCNAELAFNTLLMMAPVWVRDYVVIHELCHIKHLNHSKLFWAEVARACSHQQVAKAKNWLQVNGNQLLSIYR